MNKTESKELYKALDTLGASIVRFIGVVIIGIMIARGMLR